MVFPAYICGKKDKLLFFKQIHKKGSCKSRMKAVNSKTQIYSIKSKYYNDINIRVTAFTALQPSG